MNEVMGICHYQCSLFEKNKICVVVRTILLPMYLFDIMYVGRLQCLLRNNGFIFEGQPGYCMLLCSETLMEGEVCARSHFY